MSFSSSKECFAEDVSYQEADKDRHQPGGKNTRAWIPELLNVPSEYIHESWHMLERMRRWQGLPDSPSRPNRASDLAIQRWAVTFSERSSSQMHHILSACSN
jgi:deoxyribodipyrimidine photolyase